MSAEQLPPLPLWLDAKTAETTIVPPEVYDYTVPVTEQTAVASQSVETFVATHTTVEDDPQRSFWQKVGRSAAAVTIVAAGIAGAQAIPQSSTAAHDTARSAIELYPDKPFQRSAHTAIAPDKATVDLVTTMLKQPEDPAITNYNENLEMAMDANPDADWHMITENQKFAIRKKIADRYDLTVSNAVGTDNILRRNVQPKKSSLSLDTYIEIANDALRAQDIQITDDNSVLTRDPDTGQTANDRITDSYDTRYVIKELVEATAEQPKEYTDMLGIKQYILTTHVKDAAAYIVTSLQADIGPSIVFDAEQVGSSDVADVMNHEQGHRADFIETGGTYKAFYNDPTFEALSADAPYGKAGPEPAPGKQDTRELLATKEGWLTVQDFRDVESELSNRLSTHYNQPDCMNVAVEGEKQLVQAGERTVLTTDYSAEKNVAERKAELVRTIPQGDKYSRAMSPLLPRISEQLRNRLALLYTYRPRLARYFIDMAQRPNPNSGSSLDDPKYLEKRCEYYAQHPESVHGTK